MLKKILSVLFFTFFILINSYEYIFAEQNSSYLQQKLIADTEAKLFIENLSSKVFELLKSNIPQNEIKKSLKELLTNNFHVESISKFTLGRYKRNISTIQLKSYTNYFVDTLVNMYFDKFSLYKDATLTVESVKIKKEKTQNAYIVISSIKKSSESDKKIKWLLCKDRNIKNFQIYDVIIDEISVSKIQQDTTTSEIFDIGGIDKFIEKKCIALQS